MSDLRVKAALGVAAYLELRNMSKSALAKEIGITRQYLHAMLINKKNITNYVTQISRVLDVTEWELIKEGHNETAKN